MLKMAWLLVVVVAVACGGGQRDPETVREYLGLVCELEEDLPKAKTWGEYIKWAEPQSEEFRQITPPDVIKEYHLAALAAMDATVTFAKNQDERTVYNPFELRGPLMVYGKALEGATSRLPQEVQYAIEDFDCDARGG